MKKISILIAILMSLTISLSSAHALSSAKATAQFRGITGVNLGAGDGWTTVFSQLIKTPTAKDLFINASFEVGMTTNTAVMSKKLERAIANAEAKVEVRVIRDGNYGQPVQPGVITYAWRKQTLVAEFAGLYDLWDSECVQTTTTATGALASITFEDDPACFDAEYLQLILSTMNANSFNFIDVDVPQGTHAIEVQVRLTYDLGDGIDIFRQPDLADEIRSTTSYEGSTAWIGKGSVTIESVRMIKDDGADEPPVMDID